MPGGLPRPWRSVSRARSPGASDGPQLCQLGVDDGPRPPGGAAVGKVLDVVLDAGRAVLFDPEAVQIDGGGLQVLVAGHAPGDAVAARVPAVRRQLEGEPGRPVPAPGAAVRNGPVLRVIDRVVADDGQLAGTRGGHEGYHSIPSDSM